MPSLSTPSLDYFVPLIPLVMQAQSEGVNSRWNSAPIPKTMPSPSSFGALCFDQVGDGPAYGLSRLHLVDEVKRVPVYCHIPFIVLDRERPNQVCSSWARTSPLSKTYQALHRHPERTAVFKEMTGKIPDGMCPGAQTHPGMPPLSHNDLLWFLPTKSFNQG